LHLAMRSKMTKWLQPDENQYKILTSNDAKCNVFAYIIFYLILSTGYHENEAFDLVEKLTVRVNAEVVSAIQKSGQSAPDWLRQAARNRIDGERQAETPTANSKASGRPPATHRRPQERRHRHAQGNRPAPAIGNHRSGRAVGHAKKPRRASPFSGTDERRFRPRLHRARPVAAGRAGPAVARAGQGQEEPPKRPLPPPLPRTRL